MKQSPIIIINNIHLCNIICMHVVCKRLTTYNMNELIFMRRQGKTLFSMQQITKSNMCKLFQMRGTSMHWNKLNSVNIVQNFGDAWVQQTKDNELHQLTRIIPLSLICFIVRDAICTMANAGHNRNTSNHLQLYCNSNCTRACLMLDVDNFGEHGAYNQKNRII